MFSVLYYKAIEHEQAFSPVVENHLFANWNNHWNGRWGIANDGRCTKQRVERQRGGGDGREAKKWSTLTLYFLCGKAINQCNLVISEKKTLANVQKVPLNLEICPHYSIFINKVWTRVVEPTHFAQCPNQASDKVPDLDLDPNWI